MTEDVRERTKATIDRLAAKKATYLGQAFKAALDAKSIIFQHETGYAAHDDDALRGALGELASAFEALFDMTNSVMEKSGAEALVKSGRLVEHMDEVELRGMMNDVSRSIEMAGLRHGVKPLFAVVVFNDPEVAQYAANCQRQDMIRAMKETAQRLERKQDVTR